MAQRQDVMALNESLRGELEAAGMAFNEVDPAPFEQKLREAAAIVLGDSGDALVAKAGVVTGPSGQSVTVPAGSERSVSMMKPTASSPARGMVGSGSCGPSSPVLP